MTPVRAWSAALVLLATGLSGCIGSDDGADDGSDPTLAALAPSDEDMVLTADSTLEAPTALSIGRWWSYRMESDWRQESWTAAVVSESREGYEIRVDNPEVATFDSMWEWLLMGVHDPETLAEHTRTGELFDYLRFPLYDGARWSSTWGLGDGGVQLEHVATFDPEIPTGSGDAPGFRIEATGDEDDIWRYAYVPEVGYITEIGTFDVETGARNWRFVMTDWGDDWSGTYYIGTSQALADVLHEVDLEPSRTDVQPNPRQQFVVRPEADLLYVAAGANAWNGASRFSLTSPEGDVVELVAVSTGDDGNAVFFNDFVDVVAGEWEARMAGAGVDTEGWIFAWETVLTEHTA